MDVYRPGGVITITIFFIIIAALEIIGGVIYVFLALSVNSRILSIIFAGIIYGMLGYSPLTLIFSIIEELSYTNGYFLVGLVLLISSGLYLFSSIGLILMKRWGRYLALIVGILTVVDGVFAFLYISPIIGFLFVIFGLIVLFYLVTDVKYSFEE